MILFKNHSGSYKWGVEESAWDSKAVQSQGGDYSRFGKFIGVGDGEIGDELKIQNRGNTDIF